MALTLFAAKFRRFARHSLLSLCLVAGLPGPQGWADEKSELEKFSKELEGRLSFLIDPNYGGMDVLKFVDRGENPIDMYLRHKPRSTFGPEAPAAVRDKRIIIWAEDVGPVSSPARVLGALIESHAKVHKESENSAQFRWLFVVGVSRPEHSAPREVLEAHVPIARFGDYGLFAFAGGTSPEVAGILSDLVMRAQSPVLMEGVNVPGLTLPAGSAQDLAALVASQPATPSGGRRVVGVQIVNGQERPLYARAAAGPEATAPTSTVGPQLKGYDPKQSDPPPRQPPPLRHIDPKGPNYVKGIGTWPDENMNLQREREAREAKAAAAKKPRLTMADYAKKAEQEKADFQTRKAKAAADNKQVLNWLVNDRNTKEAAMQQRMQKRREHVDGQASRTDAVSADTPVENGPSTSDGREHWVEAHVLNRTDVSLWVTYHFFGGPPGDQYQQERTFVMLPRGSRMLTLFASPKGWDVKNVRLTWKAEPGDYLHSY